jgi:methanogenic corrinoid protein MtbC1
MVGRILSGLYVKLPLPSPDKGKAIVTAAPNEFHELGGRILADMLETAHHEVPRNVLRGALLLSGNIIHSI